MSDREHADGKQSGRGALHVHEGGGGLQLPQNIIGTHVLWYCGREAPPKRWKDIKKRIPAPDR